MSVVPLTLTISLSLVFTFIIFFLREHARSGVSSAERDSLLPLADETPHVTAAPQISSEAGLDPAAKVTADTARCGCRQGHQAPCTGCLKRPAERT